MYGPGSSHRPSIASSEAGSYDSRPHSNSGLQSYYQSQRQHGYSGCGTPRHGGGQGGEQGQMEQAKRRMAAQRERELRNYHQEQQYAKTIGPNSHQGGAGPNGPGPSGKASDRSMSPAANAGMSEEERRELIARQHRALYGNESNLYTGDKSGSRPGSGDVRRGTSPLAFDPFSHQAQGGAEGAVQMPPRGGSNQENSSAATESREQSTSSPASNQNPQFGMFENAQQSSRTSNSSPTGGHSPPGQSGNHKGVGAIGTRPTVGAQAPIQGLQKRSTTPSMASPLSYGFSANDQSGNERSTSAQSQEKGNYSSGGWGSNSGVWGQPKSGLGVQASVWG
jgi:hypothetical protein